MKRPYLQLYVADWQSNAKLKACSHAERNVWLDIMFLLHDQDEYGIARLSLKQIAKSVKAPLSKVKRLADLKILKGADPGSTCDSYVYTPRSGRKHGPPVTLIEAQPGPLWFSSRMVRDEYVRNTTGASSRFGSNERERHQEELKKLGATNIRQAVWNKTNGLCFYCKTELGERWDVDHYIPLSKGGTNRIDNLVPACKTCNKVKSDLLPEDWLLELLERRTKPPHGAHAQARASISYSDPEVHRDVEDQNNLEVVDAVDRQQQQFSETESRGFPFDNFAVVEYVNTLHPDPPLSIFQAETIANGVPDTPLGRSVWTDVLTLFRGNGYQARLAGNAVDRFKREMAAIVSGKKDSPLKTERQKTIREQIDAGEIR